jgi:signal transduction histidine kinase/CheY-like chemotaxis protein
VLSKRRVLRELQMAVEGTTDGTSEGALNHLAGALARAMRVRSVFVSEMVDPEGGRLRSLAMTIDSKAVDEIVYDMAGTPCEAVYSEGHAFYPRSVCSEFPGDSFLRGLHAQSYAGVLFRDPHGAPIGHLALVHDRELTENPTEQSLFQIFAACVGAELKRRRAEHARLAAERRLLEGQKLESLGLMASGIAHDFNNMLVAILGNADLAHARVEPGSETHDLLGEIVTASRRAGDLSRELLLFSGQRARDMRPVDLNAIVRDTTGLIQVSISKRCRINQALAERLPAVAADPSQLQRIAMNLITNASEAVGDAEGTISIGSGTRHCTRMELDSWGLGADVDEGEYVYLEVRDTGVGMNSETQRRIFDPFFSTKGQSRGLGLAALLGIVRAHGGAIQVESREGIGTAFTVYLPPSTAKAEVVAPDATPDRATRGTGRVLVVDDEPSVRRVAAAMLGGAGYEIELAADGLEAIRCFEERGDTFACVVLDLVMPRFSGEQTLLALKRLRPEVPVLISSGQATEELLARIDPATVAAVVDKPYTTGVLLHAVADAIAANDRQ